MNIIANDKDLRAAIERLPLVAQRNLAGLFATHVLELCDDERITRAAHVATAGELDDITLEDVFRGARAYTAKSYAACGHDTDWLAQAAHFTGLAAQSCVTPEPMLEEGAGPAWKAAMYARMARNCQMIANDAGAAVDESKSQYAATERYLSSRTG